MSNEKNPAVIQLEQLLAQYYEGSTGQVAAVSSSKLQAVVKHALKYCQQYKFIVWAVERYLHKCPAEYRIFGIYTIDKLARTMQQEKEGDKYRPLLKQRMEAKLADLFGYVARDDKVLPADLKKIRRLIGMWEQVKLFSRESLDATYQKHKQFKPSQSELTVAAPSLSSSSKRPRAESPVDASVESLAEQKRPEVQQKQYNPLAFDYGEDEQGDPSRNGSQSSLHMSQPQTPTILQPVIPQVMQTQAIMDLSQSLMATIAAAQSAVPQQQVEVIDPRRRNLVATPQLPDANFLANLAAQIGVPGVQPPQQQMMPLLPSQQMQFQQQPLFMPQQQPMMDISMKRPQSDRPSLLDTLPPQPAVTVRIKYADKSLPMDCVRILSRSLYIGNLPASHLAATHLQPFLEQYGAEHITINRDKFSAFTKMKTREEAEQCRREWSAEPPQLDGRPLRIAWACGFGPKQAFDRRVGATTVPLQELTDNDLSRISVEVGADFLRAHWQQVVSVLPRLVQSPDLLNKARDQQVWLGGLVVEEPDTALNAPQKGGVELLVLQDQGEPTNKRVRSHDEAVAEVIQQASTEQEAE